MRILRAGDHKQMPWKNGGGVTTEIAVSPPGAVIGDFDWRVSTAKVPESGPFSAFGNVDRVLAVLEGAMKLKIGSGEPVLLGPASPAIAFPGDVAASADVIHPVTDLNVMVRRGKFRARVGRLERTELVADAGETLVLLRAKAQLSSGETLGPDDVVHLKLGEKLQFSNGTGSAWLIEIEGR